ncbi:Hypothetical protein GLP15_1994 [Giardia lamblia P15]|uniref:Uncharacterized protein n=1 Tax=Giardia intestinalis (strain P15) TaxID=658858 RepID=E1F136_GIAIA|nr:Hypothetical protein GLP15_1994 [Giardia lamblia P15]
MDTLSAYLHNKAVFLLPDYAQCSQNTSKGDAKLGNQPNDEQPCLESPVNIPVNSSSYIRGSVNLPDKISSVLPEPSLTTQYLPTPSKTVTESQQSLETNDVPPPYGNFSAQLLNYPLKVSTITESPSSIPARQPPAPPIPQPSSGTRASTPSDDYMTLLSDLTNVSLETKSSILLDDAFDNGITRSVGDSRVQPAMHRRKKSRLPLESRRTARVMSATEYGSSLPVSQLALYQHPGSVHMGQRPYNGYLGTAGRSSQVALFHAPQDVVTEADRIMTLMHAIKDRLASGAGPQQALEFHYYELRQMYLDLLEQVLL